MTGYHTACQRHELPLPRSSNSTRNVLHPLTCLSHPCSIMYPGRLCQELDRLLAKIGNWTEGGSRRSGAIFIDLISSICVSDITGRILRRCWCTANPQRSCGDRSEGLSIASQSFPHQSPHSSFLVLGGEVP
jgi:hypothetical protein